LTQAVENRSNSLICGSTSADVVTKTSGSAVRTASAAARSCASSRQECRKQIATASTFSAFSTAIAEFSEVRSSWTSTVPSGRMRSATGKRRRRGTSAGAGGMRKL
jgi:hypothetical protein